jgi:plastocyanin
MPDDKSPRSRRKAIECLTYGRVGSSTHRTTAPMRVKARMFLTAVGVAMLWGSEGGVSSVAEIPNPSAITVKNFMFSPTPLTVKAGTTVTWTNMDDEPHTVVSDTGVFKSGGMDTNESFSFKFDKPGTYHFTCTIHPRMVGTVVVE